VAAHAQMHHGPNCDLHETQIVDKQLQMALQGTLRGLSMPQNMLFLVGNGAILVPSFCVNSPIAQPNIMIIQFPGRHRVLTDARNFKAIFATMSGCTLNLNNTMF
jgi:hypothetical protein